MKRKFVIAAIVAGLVGGLAPLGNGPAVASDCNSPIQLFFTWGVSVKDLGLSNPVTGAPIERVTPPVSVNFAGTGCDVGDLASSTVDLFYVHPGATFVSGRDNVAVCVNSHGTISGLGLHASETWTPRGWTEPDVCGGPTQVGTGGASSPTYPLDPTQLGSITASTAHGSITHRTIDR